MFVTFTDQKENKFTVNTSFIVGWQYIEKLDVTNLILSIHKPGECVSIKETPEQVIKILNKEGV